MRLLDLFEQYQEPVDEVKMSPTALEKWASGPDTEGMLMGIEFEMYYPNATTSGDGENDYDADQRVYDIEDIADFFAETEGSNRVRSNLSNDYHEWVADRIVDYVDNNFEDSELRDRVALHFDIDDYMDEARDELESERDEDEDEEVDESDIELRAQELMDAAIDECIESEDSIWEREYESYRDDLESDAQQEVSESDWLDDIGVTTAQDAEHHWGYTWPHYNEEGSTDVTVVADDLQSALGFEVRAGHGYHSVTRREGLWIVEPDSSLAEDEGGVEIISPPLPVSEMVREMKRLWNWAKSNNCYTNDSTGLHMNISVPDFSIETLDYIKLAIFSGDKYVLDTFNRLGNSYCKAATKMIVNSTDTEKAQTVIEMMRTKLNAETSKIIHKGYTDKYTSINTHKGYVEFRGPGGDWLEKTPEELSATALRLAMALNVACNPSAHKQEYAKKLYKLMSENMNEVEDNTVRLFSTYAAGMISREQLVAQLQTIQGKRKDAAHIKSGGTIRYTVSMSARPDIVSSYNFTVDAAGEQEAKRMAIELGSHYEPDLISRNHWTNVSPRDIHVFKGDAPPDLRRSLFKIYENDGKQTILAFRNMDSAFKWVTRIKRADWNNAIAIKNLETGEIQMINDATNPQTNQIGRTFTAMNRQGGGIMNISADNQEEAQEIAAQHWGVPSSAIQLV